MDISRCLGGEVDAVGLGVNLNYSYCTCGESGAHGGSLDLARNHHRNLRVDGTVGYYLYIISINQSIYLSICLSIYLSIYLCICYPYIHTQIWVKRYNYHRNLRVGGAVGYCIYSYVFTCTYIIMCLSIYLSIYSFAEPPPEPAGTWDSGYK